MLLVELTEVGGSDGDCVEVKAEVVPSDEVINEIVLLDIWVKEVSVV